MVSYPNGTTYYGGIDYATIIGKVRMETNTWGQRTFIMALPNNSTPSWPDGYRYDKIQIRLCGNPHANNEDYDIFELEYYTKGGE